jgi:hypothetical protein
MSKLVLINEEPAEIILLSCDIRKQGRTGSDFAFVFIRVTFESLYEDLKRIRESFLKGNQIKIKSKEFEFIEDLIIEVFSIDPKKRHIWVECRGYWRIQEHRDHEE